MARSPKATPPGAEGPGFTTDGATRLDETQATFRQLLEGQAIHSARRRGARGVDNTDVESSYRMLLHPSDRPLILDILSEVGLLLAGGMIGYAITLLNATVPAYGPGTVLVIAGIFVGCFCAIFKHIRL